MKKIILVLAAISLVFTIQVALAFNDKQLEINKQNVVEFYEKAINQKDFTAASQYLGTHYTQHNPTVADGPDGLKVLIQYLRENYPNTHNEIKRVNGVKAFKLTQKPKTTNG